MKEMKEFIHQITKIINIRHFNHHFMTVSPSKFFFHDGALHIIETMRLT